MTRSQLDLLKEARTAIAERNEKLAFYARKDQAEDIASMKVTAGVLDAKDYLDEVNELIESPHNLGEIKTAMAHFGVNCVHQSILDTTADTSKEAANTESASAGDELPHLAEARADMERAWANLGQ